MSRDAAKAVSAVTKAAEKAVVARAPVARAAVVAMAKDQSWPRCARTG